MLRNTFVTLLAVALSVVTLQAQEAPSREPYRTRLIPYASDAEATQRSLAKQRYMQPITAWTEVDANTLRGEYTYPFSWLERQVFVRVEGLYRPYEVWVNGRHVGGATNGFVATEFNITKASREDKNVVELRLLPAEDVAAIECFEHPAQRPVAYIIAQPRVRVRDIFWRATVGYGGIVNADFGVVMRNQTLQNKQSKLYYELYANDTTRLGGGHLDVTLTMQATDTMRFGVTIPDSLLWSCDSPNAISLRLTNRIENRPSEVYNMPIMLRELAFDDGTFYINRQAVDVKWCDVSPNATINDVERLVAAGINTLRFTAGCVSEELLDYCDSVGAYVAITAPINSSKSGKSRKRGGNPSNNPAWRGEYAERVTAAIHSTKRHSSVVAYFLADDSANGICFYEAYLAAKKVAGNRPVFYTDGGKEWNSDI